MGLGSVLIAVVKFLLKIVKWAILSFARGEVRLQEEMSTTELMQEFVRDFARQSRQ